MKIVLLDATKGENDKADAIRTLLINSGGNLDFYKLENTEIKPCRSCGSCGHATPGRCVINDGMQAIMKSMARSDMIVVLTPVVFGGYSSELKKAVDRFMPFGLPLYIMRGGHLLHPMRYREKYFMAIGLMEKSDAAQERNFKKLAANNALNFQFAHKAVVIADDGGADAAMGEIKNACEEVMSHG